MAVLYVAEFSGLYAKSDQTGQMAICPPIAQQTVVIGAGSLTCTNPFNAATNLIRVHADAACSIVIGTAPTATALLTRMAANQTEYFAVSGGDNIAVITNS
jgi:hypothetical protein